MSATTERRPDRDPLPRSLLIPDDERAAARRRLALRDYRCGCGKLLFRGYLVSPSVIAAWCKKCEREVMIYAA